MKQIIITLVAALAGGAGGALLVTSGGDSTSPPPVEDPEIGALRAQVDSLEIENRALETRIDRLERSPVASAPQREDAEIASAEPLVTEQELRELIDRVNNADSAQLPVDFRDNVAAVIEELEEQERKEREERREQERQEAMERRVQEMATELGLTPYQTDVLRGALEEGAEALMAMRDEMGGGRFDGFREAMDEIRESTQATLATVFTPEQLTKYEEEYGSSRSLFGWGRGGFGGGRGGR